MKETLLEPKTLTSMEEDYFLSHSPDIRGLLEEAISRIEASNDDPLKIATRAVSRGESNKTLEMVVGNLVGMRLLGYETGNDELFDHTEQIFLDAISGDKDSKQLVVYGLARIQRHNPEEARKNRRINYLKNNCFIDADINKLFTGPEQLGYKHLSAVHATQHTPRID